MFTDDTYLVEWASLCRLYQIEPNRIERSRVKERPCKAERCLAAAELLSVRAKLRAHSCV